MKLLTLDIETTPNLAHVWALWNQNVGLAQLRQSTTILCMAAKWHHDRRIDFLRGPDMIGDAWQLMSDADAVITYNGDSFDLPHLNREFAEHGLGMPAPYASIDLIKTVRRNFRFPSNKLDYVAARLLGQRKTPHTGHQLWIDCMAGDPKAWLLMERYNKTDVRITEKLHDRLLPWISNYPSVPLRSGSVEGCPNCGSMKAERRGYSFTKLGAYQRYLCSGCGKWYRGGTRVRVVDGR